MVTSYIQPDTELVQAIKETRSSEALVELERRHCGLFDKIANNYANCTGMCVDDIVEDRLYVLYQSALKFNPDKGIQFNTWFGTQARFHCLNSFNKTKKNIFCDPDTVTYLVDNIKEYQPEANCADEIKEIFDILNKHRDKRLSSIFYMKFFYDKPFNSFKMIGEKMGLSTQGVLILYRKALAYLKAHNFNCVTFVEEVE